MEHDANKEPQPRTRRQRSSVVFGLEEIALFETNVVPSQKFDVLVIESVLAMGRSA